MRGIRGAHLAVIAGLVVLPVRKAMTQQPAPDWAAARQAIAEGNRVWGKARVAADRATFDRMLLPDAFVQIGEHRISRQEFIDQISTNPPGVKLLRFVASVLTVTPEGDHWNAIIEEKMEYERPGAYGKPERRYALWITNDVWKQSGTQWQVASSTAVGSEVWHSVPPIPGW